MATANPRPGLQTQMRQEQQLLPSMLQSIEILALPSQELDQFLRDAALENEALALAEPSVSAGPVDRAASDRHHAMLEAQPDRAPSLAEVVEAELSLEAGDSDELAWVRFLVACLDDNGFLSIDDERLLELGAAEGLAPDRGVLGAAIARLQRLEPAGLGARDGVEALLLQLDPDEPDYPLICRLIEDFLDDVARNKLPAVARALGVELARLGELVERLRELEPRPAARLGGRLAPVVTPDVLVRRGEDGFTIELARGHLPAVTLDADTLELARSADTSDEVRRYLRPKIERARWIVSGLAQRQATLLAVCEHVFRVQRGFLEHGPGRLEPLSMGAVAEALDVAVSTISRAVSGKHVETPRGVFPLRHFFQTAVGKRAASSRDDVRERVRRIIAAESPAAPLADDDVAAELARAGLDVARRTVAKYRRELGIPSSYRRRVYD